MRNKWFIRFAVLTVSISLGSSAFSARAQQFGPWSGPVNLGATVNSACSDQHPALSKDGLTLMFASDRPLDNSSSPCLGAPTFLHLWVTQRDCLDVVDSACNWRT